MLELEYKGIKTYYYCILCVQRARGKFEHIKQRHERYKKDPNWIFGVIMAEILKIF